MSVLLKFKFMKQPRTLTLFRLGYLKRTFASPMETNNPESERIVIEIKEKISTVEQISEFVQTRKKELIPQHYNLLMGKTNRIYEDALIRLQRASSAGETYSESRIMGEIPTLASFIFKASLTNIDSVISTLSKADLVTCLSIIGKTKVSFNLEPHVMVNLEEKILKDVDQYPIIDLITLVPYFTNLNYNPTGILNKINEEERFITVPNTTIRDFLVSLIELKYTEKPDLYIKIFEQLKLASTNMEANDVCVLFDRIRDLHDIGLFKDRDTLLDKFREDYYMFFINKLSSLQKSKSEPSNANLMGLLKNMRYLNIRSNALEEVIVKVLSGRMVNHLPLSIESFSYLNEDSKKILIQEIIYNLKEKQADIRSLNFNQLAELIIEVLKFDDKEARPFLVYLDRLLTTEFNDEMEINIMSKLFYGIAKHGYIDMSNPSKFYYQYINDLCEKATHLDPDLYPRVMWALAYTEEKDLPNPLIAHLLEKLPGVKLTKPLSVDEAAEFYQFFLFVKNKIKNAKYPPEFEDLISDSVKAIAKKAYMSKDVCLHKKTQKEIGKSIG